MKFGSDQGVIQLQYGILRLPGSNRGVLCMKYLIRERVVSTCSTVSMATSLFTAPELACTCSTFYYFLEAPLESAVAVAGSRVAERCRVADSQWDVASQFNSAMSLTAIYLFIYLFIYLWIPQRLVYSINLSRVSPCMYLCTNTIGTEIR